MIIGLVSPMGSGKGEVVKILNKHGFDNITLSQMVREEAKKRGLSQKRETLMEVGNSMREKEGPGVLAKYALEKIQQSDNVNWIIDGIRNPAEIIALKAGRNVNIIGIEVKQETLVKRILKRADKKDPKEKEEIINRLEREWEEPNNPFGQQVGACMRMADKMIDNNGTLKALDNEITEYYNKIT